MPEEERPETDIFRVCGAEYKLDYSLEEKYGDELRPVRGYCGQHETIYDNHYYPFI